MSLQVQPAYGILLRSPKRQLQQAMQHLIAHRAPLVRFVGHNAPLPIFPTGQWQRCSLYSSPGCFRRGALISHYLKLVPHSYCVSKDARPGLGPDTILCGVTARPASEMVRRDKARAGRIYFPSFPFYGICRPGLPGLSGVLPGGVGPPVT